MVLRPFSTTVAAAALLLALSACWQPAAAAGRVRNANDLFYNYYAAPIYPGGVVAQMYPCPRPTPPVVGQTYFTYQPLMPQEFLYRHARTYYTHHADGQVTKTKVQWH